ncbi:branched-chain amino acid ABC transporter substrate-binding protein [Massilia sp. CF038]|uniref:branched-chain amino acid ABC transporter substrate-binding protein n=1 Tax=Massilia sp. CF038 TaxID=1881045 RepID=UPI00090EDFC0|nr:branched-chain amino acid ABC transporter substrate-binding protein [Massilia sp. CF038]SHH71362.1 amino acid/amide ABC transporter substrate-binding protein, HAAT family [Massilia sp. CF038]
MRLHLGCLCLAACCLPALGAETVVRIGSAAPVTGPSAHLGKDTENGARLAVDDLNARGFQIDGKPVRLVLLAEDDGGDPKQGTAVAQKLVDAGVVGVVGHLNSGTTVPASKIYHTAGVAQITPSATTPAYTRQGFKSAFRLVANDGRVGSMLGRQAVQRLQAQRVAVIDDRTAFGQGLADEFIKGVRAASPKVTIVSRQFTSDRATDFSAILTQIRATRPDLIFYGGMDAVAGPMLLQMKALGLDVKFMGGDGVCSEKLAQLAGAGLGEDKVLCAVAGGVSGDGEQAYADFSARYRTTFKLPLQTYAPYAYDAVMVLAKAMQEAKSAEPARFVPALARLRYHGVTGDIAFDAYGDLQQPAMTLYTYRAGKKTKLAVVR